MANIIVNSPVSVSVDGTDFGTVADAITNNPQLASDIQAALVVYDAAQTAFQQQTASNYNAYQQVAQQALTIAGQALNHPTMTDAQKLAAIHGAYQIATAPAGQLQRQQIQAQIAQLTAQLAQLPSPAAN